MELKSILTGAVIMLLLVSGIGGTMYMLDQNGQISQEEPETTGEIEVNESQTPQQVLDSKPGATALKKSFIEDYDYESSVQIRDDGHIVMYYTSNAANGNQLKEEMKDIALLYADAAAANPEVGGLMISANGVVMTIPPDAAISHGNGDINEEAYFKTVRFDKTGGNE